jgi:hypothetical protein
VPDVQKVDLSISDPISADIQAISKAVEAAFVFFASPEGQETVKAWRASTAVFNAAIIQAGDWIEKLFTGKL